MFSKLTIFTTALLAAATAVQADQCNTGAPACCQSTSTAKDPATAALLTLIGVVVQDISIPIGLTCSAISGVGVGSGSSCNQSPVCCDSIGSHGVGLNCVPINVSA